MTRKSPLRYLLLITGASLSMLWATTRVDYNHGVDFSRYHTYSWLKVSAGNDLWQDRIMRAVDEQLINKGWQRVPSGGDATVAAIGSTQTQQRLETFYNGFGGWYWRGFGDGITTTTVENVPVGTLMVDIFDSGTHKLIWRGYGSDVLSEKPEKNVKKLEHRVSELFDHFPPKSKG